MGEDGGVWTGRDLSVWVVMGCVDRSRPVRTGEDGGVWIGHDLSVRVV